MCKILIIMYVITLIAAGLNIWFFIHMLSKDKTQDN